MTENTSKPIDISTDSEITPITHQPINKVDATGWGTLTLTELHEQLDTLQNRYYTALELERYEIATAMQVGLDNLRAYITHKSDQQPNKSGV